MKYVFYLIVACVVFPSTSNAGVIYAFGQSNYNVAAGGSIDIDVYLQQTMGETILTNHGLFGASVNLFFNEPPVPSDPAEVLSDLDINPNLAFDDLVLTQVFRDPGVSAGLVGVLDLLSPAIKGSSIHLGTFSFTAGLVAGEVTKLRATDLSIFLDETIAGDGTILDGLIVDGFSQITVTSAAAVPEPASGTLAGTAVLIGWYLRRRRQST